MCCSEESLYDLNESSIKISEHFVQCPSWPDMKDVKVSKCASLWVVASPLLNRPNLLMGFILSEYNRRPPSNADSWSRSKKPNINTDKSQTTTHQLIIWLTLVPGYFACSRFFSGNFCPIGLRSAFKKYLTKLPHKSLGPCSTSEHLLLFQC